MTKLTEYRIEIWAIEELETEICLKFQVENSKNLAVLLYHLPKLEK